MRTLLVVAMLFWLGPESPQEPTVVPAIQEVRPAPYPCNLPNRTVGHVTTLACITGPETFWTCADKGRVLLRSEDDKRYCLRVENLTR